MSNSWGLPPSPPTERQRIEMEMYELLLAAQYGAPTVHIACTMEWFDWLKRAYAEKDPGPLDGLGRLVGVGIYVADDVTDPRGWEARPGTNPNSKQPSSSSKPPSSSRLGRLKDRLRRRT